MPFLAGLAAACGGPPPDPPTAVIRADPATICRGDDHQTEIRFDATESTPALTLVPVGVDPDAPGLSYAWSFEGAAHEMVGGAPTDPEVRVTSAGDRPLHAHLEVTRADGGAARSLLSIPITVPDFRPCGGGCPSGAQCVPSHLGEVCVPSAPCEFDVDCPVCSECDLLVQICVPRAGVQ